MLMTMSIPRGQIGIVFGYRKRVTRDRTTFSTVERYKHHEIEIFQWFCYLVYIRKGSRY